MSTEGTQLFDWVKDPQENADLAGSPETSAVTKTLQFSLRKSVMASSSPWVGMCYLQPLGSGTSPSVQAQDRDLQDSLPYQ
jgi:hypothetical protein